MCDDRKGSKSGIISCARGSVLKFGSMIDHVRHDYHARTIARLAIGKD